MYWLRKTLADSGLVKTFQKVTYEKFLRSLLEQTLEPRRELGRIDAEITEQ